jgi:hypothetical protein
MIVFSIALFESLDLKRRSIVRSGQAPNDFLKLYKKAETRKANFAKVLKLNSQAIRFFPKKIIAEHISLYDARKSH